MESCEALRACIGPYTKEVAKRLGRSTQLVHKWQEPTSDFSESGSLNPLDRLEAIMEEALAKGQPHQEVMTPLSYLASRVGATVVQLPEARQETEAMQVLCLSVKEFGEYAAAVSDALADGSVSRPERRRVLQEGWEAVAALVTVLEAVEQACPMSHKRGA